MSLTKVGFQNSFMGNADHMLLDYLDRCPYRDYIKLQLRPSNIFSAGPEDSSTSLARCIHLCARAPTADAYGAIKRASAGSTDQKVLGVLSSSVVFAACMDLYMHDCFRRQPLPIDKLLELTSSTDRVSGLLHLSGA